MKIGACVFAGLLAATSALAHHSNSAFDGDNVVVQSKEVSAPTQVRFGWRNIANPNLVNKEGLPASPFRTKNWQGGTGE